MAAGIGGQPHPAHAFPRAAAHVVDLLPARMPPHTADAAGRGIGPPQTLNGEDVLDVPTGDSVPLRCRGRGGRRRYESGAKAGERRRRDAAAGARDLDHVAVDAIEDGVEPAQRRCVTHRPQAPEGTQGPGIAQRQPAAR